MIVNIFVLILLISCSAFFSAAEMAFFSLSSAKITAMVKKKVFRARMVEKLKNNHRRLLVTILIGNTLVNISAASYATIVTSHFFSDMMLGVTAGIMTILILTFGEIMPKAYATSHAKKIAIFSAPILIFLGWVLYPIIWCFEWLIIFLTGKQQIEKVSAEEVQALASASIRQGVFSEQEGVIMHRVFRFNDITAKNVMTPMDGVAFVSDDLTLGRMAELIKINKHSRFPVIHGSMDNIVGIVHAKDLFVALAEKGTEDRIINHMFPIFFVEANMPIDDLLTLFQKKRSHMAIVKDKKEKVIGMVTLEDVLEELVGEIEDEYDKNTKE